MGGISLNCSVSVCVDVCLSFVVSSALVASIHNKESWCGNSRGKFVCVSFVVVGEKLSLEVLKKTWRGRLFSTW